MYNEIAPPDSPIEHDHEVPEIKRKKVMTNFDWENLPVPWEKFDCTSMDLIKNNLAGCNDKKKKEIITNAVHYVVNDVREINHHAPAAAFRNLAEKMCAKYGAVFEDRQSDGERLGCGFTTLENKLIERNRYLNRESQSDSVRSRLHIPIQDSKKYQALKAGCVQWQPEFDVGFDEKSTENLREYFLKFEDLDLLDDAVVKQVVQNFSNSFALQRLYINNSNNSASVIKDKWPILFHEFYAKFHFQFLTGRKSEIFITNFENDVLKLLVLKHLNTSIPILDFQRWDALNVMFEHFKEKLSDLFTPSEVCTLFNLCQNI